MRVVREGRSFSGRERHCLFLNLGNGEFADVSAVSGFDLDDDGRGLGLVDWDADGDLDLWLTNRNGPQVRFLLNKSKRRGHSISITLQGTSSNRDAVGARVEVYAVGQSKPWLRSLRAGDGFLSQSSKRLVIGVGQTKQLSRIVVRWPGGPSETFLLDEGLLNCHYHLVQGSGSAECRVEKPRMLPQADNETLSFETSPAAHAMCFSMIRLPITEIQGFDDTRQAQPIVAAAARLTLLNLWSSWCQPCLEELQALAKGEQQLRQRGIEIVALSLDAVSSRAVATGADQRLLQKINFPFRAGRAGRDDLEKLQLLNDTIFELRAPLPIPTSFLIDRRARVVAIYKGPVSVDQLLADAAQLRVRTTDQWRRATLPWDGRWQMPPRRRHLFDFVSALADRGYYRECQMYVRANRQMFISHPAWPRLFQKISNGLDSQ